MPVISGMCQSERIRSGFSRLDDLERLAAVLGLDDVVALEARLADRARRRCVALRGESSTTRIFMLQPPCLTESACGADTASGSRVRTPASYPCDPTQVMFGRSCGELREFWEKEGAAESADAQLGVFRQGLVARRRPDPYPGISAAGRRTRAVRIGRGERIEQQSR